MTLIENKEATEKVKLLLKALIYHTEKTPKGCLEWESLDDQLIDRHC